MGIVRTTFKKDGQVEIKTIGFEGDACREASKHFETLHGAVTSDKPTDDAADPTAAPPQTNTTELEA